MNYFKSYYDKTLSYSPDWYGTLSYAPPATVLLYNDNEGFCIGYMESELPEGVQAMTDQEALAEVAQAEDIDGVFFGDKLATRWEEGGIDGE